MEMESDRRKLAINIKKDLDRNMIGQNNYKELMAEILSKHIVDDKVSSSLIIGPTGSGKTFLIDLLRKSKYIPSYYTIMSINVSRLTEEGISGPSLSDYLSEYVSLCKSKLNRQYKGLIYFDEVDKIVMPSYISTSGVSSDKNAPVQHQLMQVLDGGSIDGISVKNTMFVFGGAFHKLDENKEEQSNQNTIGFLSGEISNNNVIIKNDIRDKLIDFGFQREFLGRIQHICRINALTEKELAVCLLHPSNGIISKIQRAYEEDGIRLECKPSAVDELIKAIKAQNLGARSVNNVMLSLLEGAWFKCINGEYDRIVIDKKSILTGEVIYERSNSKEKKIVQTTASEIF
ncbi:MAG: AAA family ATPase [Lachnospiraceae bacterium]|nr:AAA family ATPase [Lachnospiraceae bacterium]